MADTNVSRFPLGPIAMAGFGATAFSLLLWGAGSVFIMARAVSVPWWAAWIPPMALGGVMLCSTAISLQDGIDLSIRRYAGGLSALAIVGEIIVAGAQHYLAVGHADMPAIQEAAWGAVIGGIPSLMGGCLVHVFAMVCKQRRREAGERAAAERSERAEVSALSAAERIRQDARSAERTHAAELRTLAEHTAAANKLAADAEREKLAAIQQRTELAAAVIEGPRLRLAGGTATEAKTRPAKAVPRPRITARQKLTDWLLEQHRKGATIAEIRELGQTAVAEGSGININTVKRNLSAARADALALMEAAG